MEMNITGDGVVLLFLPLIGCIMQRLFPGTL